MRPKPRSVFVITVQDRISGERLEFEITARSVHEAEAQAHEAGWLVVDPSGPAPEPTEAEKVAAAQETAVKRGGDGRVGGESGGGGFCIFWFVCVGFWGRGLLICVDRGLCSMCGVRGGGLAGWVGCVAEKGVRGG